MRPPPSTGDTDLIAAPSFPCQTLREYIQPPSSEHVKGDVPYLAHTLGSIPVASRIIIGV